MNVNLTPKLEKLVQNKVNTGRYNSASEVVREALRLLEENDKIRAAQLAGLRIRIDEGLASLDRGEGVDGERFMGKLISDLEAKPTRRKNKCSSFA